MSLLASGSTIPSISEINTALPEELVMAFFEVVALQDNADSPQDHLSLLLDSSSTKPLKVSYEV